MIHDYLTSEKMNGVRLPKLKGHVKLVLHNPRTGKNEVHEGDNMITNALKDIFASNYAGAMDYSKLLPIYAKMLGGVLCFKNQLDITSEGAADDYFIPDSTVNQLTAHAGQTSWTSQADDVKRGNPLSSSMSVHDGAVTLAWEWGTAAGNGEIKSVALTHSDVGDAGLGSNSDAFNAMTPCVNAFNGVTLTPATNNLTYCVLFVGKDGHGYRFTCSGQTVTIYKIAMPYEKVGLVGTAYNDTAITSTTVATTASFSSQPSYFYDMEHDYLWLFYSTAARSVSFEKIRIADTTVIDHGTIALDADCSLNCDSYPLVCPFDGTYVYFRNYTTGPSPIQHQGIGTLGFLKVKLSSTGDQSTTGNARVFASGGVFVPNAANRIIAGQGFVINGGVTYHTSYSSPANWYEYFARTPVMEQRVGLVQLSQMLGTFGGQKEYWNSVSKFYLGSKFNLDNTVTKTNAQSMTLTYTLTEVSE